MADDPADEPKEQTCEEQKSVDVAEPGPEEKTAQDGENGNQVAAAEQPKVDTKITCKEIIVIGILFTINLVNYMDRLTISVVLTEVQAYFDIDNAQAGFIKTIFLTCFLGVAPVCGFLGDRYNRKWILVFGLVIWIGGVMALTFVPANLFYLFLGICVIVGVGEASYSIIAPSINMFKGTVRSKVIMVFYLAIPIGSGLGYVVGSNVAAAMGAWQWGLRITPIIGAICVIVLIVFVDEPKREVLEKMPEEEAGSIFKDIWYLMKNKTYVFSTWGCTFMIFTVGTLSWWIPYTIEYAKATAAKLPSVADLPEEERQSIGTVFGMVVLSAGLVGVITGTVVATMWKKGRFCFSKSKKADIFVCIIGSTGAVPFLYIAMAVLPGDFTVFYVFVFLSITHLSLNWAVTVDLLMYIVPPRKRNIASAFQITVGHAFGDAASPAIVGKISDLIAGDDHSPPSRLRAIKLAFWLPNLAAILSAIMFILSAFTLHGDFGKLQKLEDNNEKNPDTTNNLKTAVASDV
ncbi:unnamed protein product [Bursaphelenchus okinawaensis]|uniref:Major facilitator superfamily (MFS) profile domain-containing protein n=1 Tax=Bursaphelenchus okinawaensis TaxID=465554 RepID=A0A811L8B5_9BILA|nr:unnamed protein product [Bursaphelenchus okinawaensis]CAG9118163.1 unnamed protein product [Bursaphelenchus okinawaensis]